MVKANFKELNSFICFLLANFSFLLTSLILIRVISTNLLVVNLSVSYLTIAILIFSIFFFVSIYLEINTMSKAKTVKIEPEQIKELEDHLTKIIENKFEEEIETIKGFKEEIQEVLKEMKKSRRQDMNLTSAYEALSTELSNTQSLVNESLTAQLEEVKTLLKESMTLRQNEGNLQREIEKWQRFAVEFFDNLERMLDYQKDNGSKQIIEKVIRDLDKLVDPLKLERITPLQGDNLNEELHQANEEEKSSNIEPGKILKCKKWGYKINGKLYQDKRAEVILAMAPQNTENEQKPETSQENFDYKGEDRKPQNPSDLPPSR